MGRFFSFIKRHWLITAIVVVVGLGVAGIIIRRKNSAGAGVLTDTVKQQDLTQTVLATGQVTSSTDLKLSFKGSGIVAKIYTQVGQQVHAGDILANLDQKDQLAGLTSARGSWAAAQANYRKVLDGAGSEEVRVSQVALDNAQQSLSDTTAQQAILVTNARKALLNSTLAAVPVDSNLGAAPIISGTYNSNETGSYEITFYNSTGGVSYIYKGLEQGVDTVDTGSILPLGKRGLYLQFTALPSVNDKWRIEIPNTRAANYVTNLNAYNAALQTQQSAVTAAQNAVASAQAALDLKKAQARPADIAAAQAQILSAQGQVQAASAALENTVIRAPSNGTITSVDIKVGEQATPSAAVIILQDVGSLHVEANVSEANIASVKTGQEVKFTFDALGPDRAFKGTVQTIDPASTVVSGVVNYKVTALVENLPEIKPGMTANMTILSASKANVLAIAQRAVISRDNKKFVRVLDNPQKKTYHEVEVTTGMEADGGLVEVTSGLSAGQGIVTFINSK